MSLDLDTSVVLRLITGQPTEQLEAARACVAAAALPVTVSDLAVAESYHALRYHYSVPHPDAIDALRALLNDSRIRGNGIAPHVLAEPTTRQATKSTAGFVDRLIHAGAVLDQSTLVTFDRALARLNGVQLLR